MKNLVSTIFIFTLLTCNFVLAQNASSIKTSGTMRNVMRMGQLYGTIDLDTISPRKNLYGIGPLENLKGELMIVDGISYISRVNQDGKVLVDTSWKVKAPFFVYANVETWKEQLLPDSITNLSQLEIYLTTISMDTPKPFTFKLTGIMNTATIHVLNLPTGKTVSSHEQAHEGVVKTIISDEQCDLVGFFSTEHQGIFTHHDTFIHVHLINAARNKMGHLEDVSFRKGTMKVFLQE